MKLCSVLALLDLEDTQKWSHGHSLGVLAPQTGTGPLWPCPMQFLCLNFHRLSLLTELSPRSMIYAY